MCVLPEATKAWFSSAKRKNYQKDRNNIKKGAQQIEVEARLVSFQTMEYLSWYSGNFLANFNAGGAS